MMRPLNIRALFLRALGLMLCCLPAVTCILLYFPLWKSRGAGAVLSGFTVLLLALAMLPFYRSVKRFFESSASYTLWLIAFVLFLCLSKIADEMTVISFAGLIGNLLGAACFKLAERSDARRSDNG